MSNKKQASDIPGPTSITEFLNCETPMAWINAATRNIPLLLIDHGNCEKKAASSAIGLMFRYGHYADLTHRMSRLAREELRHFEQVQRLINQRQIEYQELTASRYAGGLRKHISKDDHQKLVDTLITGAFIEARSCERFQALAPHLDAELSKFYLGLCASESRHFVHYLELAKQYAEQDIGDRVAFFADVEEKLIVEPDTEFRFHSGPV